MLHIPILKRCLLPVTLIVCANAVAGDLHAARLSVVFDEDNMPYSKRGNSPAGLNVDIARLIAMQFPAELDVQWADTANEGLLGFLIKENGEVPVQMAVGVPLEPRTVEDEERVGKEVLFSEPFASTRYVLVTRKEQPDLPDFRAIGRAPIAVESGSIASTTLWDKGFTVQAFPSQEHILSALAAGKIEYAVLWSNAGWSLQQDDRFGNALRINNAAPSASGLSWNLAVAVGKSNAHLLKPINEAVAKLRQTGAFKPIFKFYGLPFFEPEENEE